MANLEVKDKTKKGCFRYLEDDEIDSIIINRINSSPKRGGKAKDGWTESEIKLRNSVVLDYICNQGISRTETQKILAKRWGVTDRTAYRYVKEALDELVVDYDEFAEYSIVQHLKRLESILEDSILHNDRKSALSALDQIAKVQSLYVEKKDINVNSDTISFDFQ